MKDVFIMEVEVRLSGSLTSSQMQELDRVLRSELEGKDVSLADGQEKDDGPGNAGLAGLFLSAKRTEGCSERTEKNYGPILENFCAYCGNRDLRLVDADFIRSYLAAYQARNGCGNVTLDNVRRVLSSFYGWLEGLCQV